MSYWEVNHDRLVKDVLEVLLSILRFISYDYTVLDSTKFMDWRKHPHEAFISVRVRLGEALYPIHADTNTSEVEFTKGLPPGSGLAFADGAFDAKPVLNELAHKR